MLNEIIDSIINSEPTSRKNIDFSQAGTKENLVELQKISDIGRSALELEASKAYQDLIPKNTRLILEQNIKTLIVEGISMSNEQKNALLIEIRCALSPMAVIRKAKQEAHIANEFINKEAILKESIKKKEEKQQLREKGRQTAINRKVGAEKAVETKRKKKDKKNDD